MSMPDPIRLTPSLREKVWGKTRLTPWFPNPAKPIGEAWYLGPAELPILVKLLFTSAPLSVQVHPADGDDGPHGKTEMWHILEADRGASVAVGFREPITRQRLLESSQTGEIERLLNWVPVKPGDTWFIPAHTVHAIGAGIVLCEIQQNSDITYRLWDYGRAREMHLAKAVPICDLGVHPGVVKPTPLASGRQELARCKYFVTELVQLQPGESFTPTPQACQMWIAITGSGSIGAQPFHPGEVWLLPETGPQPEIRADDDARFLRTYLPA
jgi:mannose-6-phosphate isomerase